MEKEILTIQIDPELKKQFLETVKKREDDMNSLLHRFIQAYVFDRSLEDRLNLYLTVERMAQETKWLRGNERLPCGMTAVEYDCLSDKEEAALWTAEYCKLLEVEEPEADFKEEEIPHVITPRQRRDSDQFKRLLELRPQQAPNGSAKRRS